MIEPATFETQSALPAGFAPVGQGARDPDGFIEAMRTVSSRTLKQEPTARQAAEDLVAITLVQPILAQLRESNQAAAPFGPTDVERRFGHMWDAEIARRMVQSRGFGLVDAVARSVQMRVDSARAGDAGAAAEDRDDGRHEAGAARHTTIDTAA
jgi:Rod binding domain-containing protein